VTTHGVVLSVDPSSRGLSGVALSFSDTLAKCGLFARPIHLAIPDVLVLELPEIYRGGQARPEDIITLTLAAGGWRALNPSSTEKLPHPKQWKGQVSKACTARRVLKALTSNELMVLKAGLAEALPKLTWEAFLALAENDKKFEKHPANNITDAVALNLWYLGRYR
jgi:hypothetical protein